MKDPNTVTMIHTIVIIHPLFTCLRDEQFHYKPELDHVLCDTAC